ncbi:MAG: hypothetical protein N3G76_01290 [Candidatus Micrarchaeota archaeon]|nr:hypothetical protein [Candidatus Micrarchaeota archaeon]
MGSSKEGLFASLLGMPATSEKKPGTAVKHSKARLVRGVCIYCTKQDDGKPKHVTGYPIKEDYVISAIRWIKRKTKTEQGNRLVVCEKHAEEHQKKRGGFERSLIIYGGIGAFLMLILLVMSLSLGSFLAGLLLLIFLLATAHMRYVPKAEGI